MCFCFFAIKLNALIRPDKSESLKNVAIEWGVCETAVKEENNYEHLTSLFMIRDALLHCNKTEVGKYRGSIKNLCKKEDAKFQPGVPFSKKTSALYQKASEWCKFKCFQLEEKNLRNICIMLIIPWFYSNFWSIDSTNYDAIDCKKYTSNIICRKHIRRKTLEGNVLKYIDSIYGGTMSDF